MTQAEREPLQGRSTTGLHTAPGRLATGLQLARSRAPAIRAALLIALLLFVLAFLREFVNAGSNFRHAAWVVAKYAGIVAVGYAALCLPNPTCPRASELDQESWYGLKDAEFLALDKERIRAYVWDPLGVDDDLDDSDGGGIIDPERGGQAETSGRTWAVVLHGNAGNRLSRMPWLAQLRKWTRCGLVVPEYRGDGGSTGSPSMRGLQSDVLGLLAWLGDRERSPLGPADRVFLVGESLGTAMAVFLAQHVARTAPAGSPPGRLPFGATGGPHLCGMVLQMPMSSALEAAALRFPHLPSRLLMRDPFPSIDWQRGIPEGFPKMVMHGDVDTIVPYQLGRRLYSALSGPKHFVRLRGFAHNDITAWVCSDPEGYLGLMGRFFRNPLAVASVQGSESVL